MATAPIATGIILNAAAATGEGDTYQMSYAPSTEGLWQVTITGTATVVLKGRVHASMGWETVATRSATGSDVVPIFPEMCAEVTAYTSGAVTVGIASKPN